MYTSSYLPAFYCLPKFGKSVDKVYFSIHGSVHGKTSEGLAVSGYFRWVLNSDLCFSSTGCHSKVSLACYLTHSCWGMKKRQIHAFFSRVFVWNLTQQPVTTFRANIHYAIHTSFLAATNIYIYKARLISTLIQ